MREKHDTKALDAARASLDAELALVEDDRRSNLDVEKLVELRESDYMPPIADAAPRLASPDEHGRFVRDAALASRLEIYVGVVQWSLAQLVETHRRQLAATSAARRYTAEAFDTGRVAHGVYVSVRERLHKRLPQTKVGKQIRETVGVGANVPDDGPATVARYARAAVEALKEPKYAETFALVDVDAKLLLRRLSPVLAELEAALTRSPSEEKKGEVNPELQRAVLRVDIAFQRLIAFLDDHDAKAEAVAVNGRLPRKLQRRSTDVKVAPAVVGEGGAIVTT